MSNTDIKIPSGAEFIINRLTELGYRADIVGGPVRDFLLGRIPDDFDVTTNAYPDEVVSAFSDMRVIKTGIAHGTVTVLVDSVPFEVTTYRIDGEYSDSRHPDSVEFTSRIEDDLARRDFTVNAMAYSEKYGLTDVFGGRADLAARVIRAVGCPEKRFTEDALRILRALRFAAVLGFEIERKTAEALVTCKELLKNVSAERIFTEWKKLLSGKGAYKIIAEFSSVIAVFLPELDGLDLPPRGSFDSADGYIRNIAIFAKIERKNAAECFELAMQRLKTDKRTREDGVAVLNNISDPVCGRREILHLLSEIGKERAELLLSVRAALGENVKDARKILEELLVEGAVFTVGQLAVGGKELMALGLSGAKIGATLSELLALVMDGKIQNNKEELILYLKSSENK